MNTVDTKFIRNKLLVYSRFAKVQGCKAIPSQTYN